MKCSDVYNCLIESHDTVRSSFNLRKVKPGLPELSWLQPLWFIKYQAIRIWVLYPVGCTSHHTAPFKKAFFCCLPGDRSNKEAARHAALHCTSCVYLSFKVAGGFFFFWSIRKLLCDHYFHSFIHTEVKRNCFSKSLDSLDATHTMIRK